MNFSMPPAGSPDQTTLEIQQQLERIYISLKQRELDVAIAGFQRPLSTSKVAASGFAQRVCRLGASRKSRERALLADSTLFDADWYRQRYPDVAQSGVDPVHHYLHHGAAEMRDPGPHFSTRHYLAMYPDVREAGINPLLHYLGSGWEEMRVIRPSLLHCG